MNKLPLPSSILARLTAPGLLVGLVLGAPPDLTADERPLRTSDVFSLKDVGDPQLSPDGRWVAYTVRTLDAKKDDVRHATSTWLPFAGGEPLRLTSSHKAETRPALQPGRPLPRLPLRAATARRPRSGSWTAAAARPSKLTDYKAERLGPRLVARRQAPGPRRVRRGSRRAGRRTRTTATSTTPTKTAKPIVIRRLQFKRDGEGYLRDLRSTSTSSTSRRRRAVQLTSGPYDDSEPPGRPTGGSRSSATARPTRTPTEHRHLRGGGRGGRDAARASPTAPGDGPRARLEPGRQVDRLRRGRRSRRTSGTARTTSRWFRPRAARRGRSPRRSTATSRARASRPTAARLLPAGGRRQPAPGPRAGRGRRRRAGGRRRARRRRRFDVGAGREIACWRASRSSPREVSRRSRAATLRRAHARERRVPEGHPPRRRSSASRRRAPTARTIDGFLTLPPGARRRASRLPTILRIHGGPASQYSTGVRARVADARRPRLRRGRRQPARLDRATAATSAAPSGPTGATRTIEDVMAAVDHAVAHGRRRSRPAGRRRLELRRDPDRLRHHQDRPLQGRHLRRQRGQLPRQLRHRPLPVRVGGRAGPAVEEHASCGCGSRRSSRSRRSRRRRSSSAARTT